jgi:hypothetical protein
MRTRFWAVYLLCLPVLATIVFASGDPLAHSLEVRSPSCATLPESLWTAPPAQDRQTSCLEGAYCNTVQDCAALCSGFATANCVDNECRYTYGSPGGGSGGGGTGGSPYCLATPCQTFQDCVCLRPDGIYDFGQCLQGSCQY